MSSTQSIAEGETVKETTQFTANLDSSMGVLHKDDDRMVIWGPASIEMVDKENDRITADALENALPQLLRRSRLSLEHADQLVGDIKDNHTTEEAKDVVIDGHEYTRKEFPTDVLDPDDGDDVPEKGLYVCGEVWSDTQQAKQTQEDISEGDIDSYSISGEAVSSSTRVKDGDIVDDIEEIDLSAVTLCEEGMNPKAKFAVISKAIDGAISPGELSEIARSVFSKTMGENEDDGEDSPDNASEAAVDKEELREEFKAAAEEVLSERDLASKDDVQNMVEERFSQKEEDDDMPEDMGDDDDDEDTEEKVAGIEEKLDELIERMPGDDDEVDPDELEDPDSDGDEEMDLPMDDDDDMSDDEEEEQANTIQMSTLKSSLPDDLVEAVKEHVGPGQADEMKSEDDDDDVAKSAEEYAEREVGPVTPAATDEFGKSWESDSDDGTAAAPGTLDDFYESVGEDI